MLRICLNVAQQMIDWSPTAGLWLTWMKPGSVCLRLSRKLDRCRMIPSCSAASAWRVSPRS